MYVCSLRQSFSIGTSCTCSTVFIHMTGFSKHHVMFTFSRNTNEGGIHSSYNDDSNTKRNNMKQMIFIHLAINTDRDKKGTQTIDKSLKCIHVKIRY